MDELRSHASSLVSQARRNIRIYTDDLEAWLYDQAYIEKACSDFLISRPQNVLQLLVRDSSRASREGHRLIRLARKLTSNFQVRKINPNYDQFGGAFLVVDDCGVLLRNRTSSIQGEVYYDSTAVARRHLTLFERTWERALADPNLRSFVL